MKMSRKVVASLFGCTLLVQCLALLTAVSAYASTEYKLGLLQIGTQTYTNATVTSKAEKYIFLRHAGGLESIKVAELPPEIREKLGYELPKPKTNGVTQWTSKQVAKIHTPELAALGDQLKTGMLAGRSGGKAVASPAILAACLGVVILVYVCFCYCGMLICQKTGNEPGALIWIPVVQILPLLRAAGMSPAWLIAFLIPVLNIVAQIVWSCKVVKARDKSPLLAILLILPLTNIAAFAYLAFAGADAKQPKAERGPEIMTLETV